MFVSVGAPKRDSALHGIIVIIVIVRARLGKEKKNWRGVNKEITEQPNVHIALLIIFSFILQFFLLLCALFFFSINITMMA